MIPTCSKLLVLMLALLQTVAAFEKKENIDYVGQGNPRQMLDLYLPGANSDKKLPVIVWIHGGAWRQGSKKSVGRVLRAAKPGECAIVSVNYRLTGEAKWPAQIHDCKAAIRWIRANAGKHQLDPNRIVVWGASAGGHLVSMLGTTQNDKNLDGKLGPHTDQSTSVKAVVNFFGPTDFTVMNEQGSAMNHDNPDSPEGMLLGGRVSELGEKAKSASPFFNVSKDDAPVLTVHGTADRLVPYKQGLAFDKKLDDCGVASVLLTVKDGGHGKGFGPSVQKAVSRFLNEHLFGKKHALKDSAVNQNE